MRAADRAHRYAADVLSGKQLAPLTIKQACQRFMADFKREDIYFDADTANAVADNIETLPHVKGRWQGQPIVLEDHQCFEVANLFGWRWADTGLRRFRYAYVQKPRKNGKTLLAIAIGLHMFALSGEAGAEVYMGAVSQDHARDLLFNPASFMVRRSELWREQCGIEVYRTSLVIPETFSVMKACIKRPPDGWNASCAICDELHEHDSDEQWSTFDTGMGSRDQALLYSCTTAGSNLASFANQIYRDCKQILSGAVSSDSWFVLIWEPDEGDAWDDPEVLRKVNPNLGISVDERYLLDQLDQARRSASKQAAYRTKHLNQWVGSASTWMNEIAWHRQTRQDVRLEDFKGKRCRLSVDLASKKDICALVWLFREGEEYTTFSKFYAPESAVADTEGRYREMEIAGDLVITPGSKTDHAFIEQDILDACRDFRVEEVIFDPFQSDYIITRLMERGIECIEYPNTVKNMSHPMKEVEAAVLDGKLVQGKEGSTCMRWMMGCVEAHLDAKDNIYPRKNAHDPRVKIDGPVAMIMNMGRWLTEDVRGSYLESADVVAF